jgi:hypothetical protein
MDHPLHPPDPPPGNKNHRVNPVVAPRIPTAGSVKVNIRHRVNLAVDPRRPTAGSAKVSIRHRIITNKDQIIPRDTRDRAGMLYLSRISFVLK